jgi:hypothetical protein
MFLLRSSAVDGTYSFALDFRLPLLGMNSLTHSPLAAAISLSKLPPNTSFDFFLKRPLVVFLDL